MCREHELKLTPVLLKAQKRAYRKLGVFVGLLAIFTILSLIWDKIEPLSWPMIGLLALSAAFLFFRLSLFRVLLSDDAISYGSFRCSWTLPYDAISKAFLRTTTTEEQKCHRPPMELDLIVDFGSYLEVFWIDIEIFSTKDKEMMVQVLKEQGIPFGERGKRRRPMESALAGIRRDSV